MDWYPRFYYKFRNKTSGVWYVGQRERNDVGVKYFGSGAGWRNHCKENGGYNEHNLALEELVHFTDKSAAQLWLDNLKKLEGEYWLDENIKWANRCEETVDNCSSKTPVVAKKISESNKKVFNDPLWKDTVGVIQISKQKETKSDPHWKATIGREQAEKISAKTRKRYRDDKWVRETGELAWKAHSVKMKDKMNDPEWLNSDAGRRSVATRFSTEWRLARMKTCPHCGKTTDPGNFGKHHGERCKHK